jgi:protein-S-isoprenylcysteine O-methyltransferase Ste14
MITSEASYIVFACWAIFLLYWFISARSAKPTQERKQGMARFRLLIIGVIVVLLILQNFGLIGQLLTTTLIPHTTLIRVISVVFLIVGLGIAIVARRTLAGNWSNVAELKVDHELITTGIYRYVRHPIYTGVLLMMIGTVLVSGTTSVLLIFLVLVGVFWFNITQEEKLLTEYFPNAYPAYKQRSKAIIPYIL